MLCFLEGDMSSLNLNKEKPILYDLISDSGIQSNLFLD